MDTTIAHRCFRALVLSLAILTGAGTASAAASFMTPVNGTKAVRSQFDIKSKPAPVMLSRATLGSLKNADELELILPNATRHMVIFDRVEDHGGGIRSSVGYLKEHGKDYRVIITTGPGGAFGSIRTPDTHYRIIPGLDGQDLLVDMTEEQKLIPYIDLGDDSRRVPDDANSATKHAGLPATLARATDQAGEPVISLVKPSPQNTVDLMIVYTNGLAAQLGSGLLTRLYNLVTAANTAYADSEVAITLRLVNATMVNYTDAGGSDTALYAISPVVTNSVLGGVGVFSNIETIRNANGADMVAFLRNGGTNSGNGIAWLTTSGTPNANYMYSVTTGCTAGCDSVFIHELGHNMGNAHDRATAAYQSGNPNPSAGAFPYSFGHYFCASGVLTCNPFVAGGCGTQPQCSTTSNNNVGTIMSYFNPVTLKFSNPNLTCLPGGGGGTPQPCGVLNQEDNALSMNNMRLALQNVKPTLVATPTGAIQFAASSFGTTETGGSVTITVSRVGGSGGSVSVNYATQDGTAKAGFDYANTSGTLNWGDGDTANKTFTVALVNDGVTEGGEYFTVNLSNPAGTTGIFLGQPAAVSVQITEGTAWPPGGTFPAGFVAPGSVSGVWSLESVAANCASGQSPCLGSPQVLATITDFSTYENSDLQYSALFPAGNVTFSYRVSSLATTYANLQLLIDGVVAFSSVGGETGWLTTSVPIVAGSHTITWRFRNRVYFPCANASSPIPPPNCKDRAWIDDVLLPVSVASSSTALVASANPSTPGQSVTFTATVTGASGTPAGVVTFRDAGAIITGCNLVVMTVGGTAQCTTSALSAGAHAITAAYSGNSTYDVSTSAILTQNVNGFPLTVTKAGLGSGNVTSSPAGIDTAVNSNVFGYGNGVAVALTQVTVGSSNFGGWSGDCTGTGACSVTMNPARNVTATFNAQCVIGTFSATGFTAGVTPCTSASPGNFVSTVGAMSQTQCVAGTYQPNSGASACLPASAGSFVAFAGSASQALCAVGTYQPATASTSCLQAAPGRFVATTGSSTQTLCNPGSYQPNSAASSCIAAGAGNFVSASGAIAQTQCVAGTYQSATGATSCIAASAGSFVASGGATGQTSCAVGTYQPSTGAIACIAAAAGNFVSVTGATSQTACGIGTFQANTGANTCNQAAAGKFVATVGATTDTACAPGSFQALTGASSCDLAQPGFFVATSGAIAQTVCPVGTTSTTSGATACVSILPSAPTIGAAVAGNAQANISFGAPASNGGSPILDYTMTCVGPNTLSPTGAGSPIIVTGLTNNQLYSCSATARNANGSGPASATVNVTPLLNAPLALNSVWSRKNHPVVGNQEIQIDTNVPLGGLVTVEPRLIGAGHQIVFRFNNTVTAVASSAVTTGSATHTINGSEVVVMLTGVADNQRVTVSLGNVNGSLNSQASMGFLVGDVSNSRSVNSSDISAVKAHGGQTISGSNFRYDLNADGVFNQTDISAAKARSGRVIP